MAPKGRVSRRGFLQNAAGLAAVSGLAQNSAYDRISDTRRFRLGLIGCGKQATTNLIPAALKVPGVSITALCDIIPERTATAQKLAGGQARVFDGYRNLLKEADMDGVVIATPLHLHRPMIEEALKNGRHVFCERMMGLTLEDCRAILKAQKDSGKIVKFGYGIRYNPAYYTLRAQFMRLLGPGISNIHCQWNLNSAWRNPVAPVDTPDLRKWGYETPDELFNWHLYRKYSGGVMTEWVADQIDVLIWLLGGRMPLAVKGVGAIDRRDGRTVYDNVHLIYEYPNNVEATFEAVTTNSFSSFGEAYIMLQGLEGTIVMAHGPACEGLFFLEPDVSEQLWMPMTQKAPFDAPNIIHKEYKKAFVISIPFDGPASRIPNFADLPLMVQEVFDYPTGKPLHSTFEFEILAFKLAVLNGKKKYECDAAISFKSAVATLSGLEAMETKQRIPIPRDILAG